MDARALYHSIGDPERFWRAADYAGRFAMSDSPVHKTLRKLTATLEEAGIPYAIAGAMALGQHGFVRATAGVEVLLTREGLAALKARVPGLGYVEKFPGSKGLRDTENGVTIDVLLAGEFPGDGKPKPIAFPDPAVAGVAAGGARFLELRMLIEMKLASGMTAVHRVKDLGDVIALIRAAKLPRDLGEQLHPYVRGKYDELWLAVQAAGDEDY